jgi:hypothetical protein
MTSRQVSSGFNSNEGENIIGCSYQKNHWPVGFRVVALHYSSADKMSTLDAMANLEN